MSKYLMSVIPNNGVKRHTVEVLEADKETYTSKYLEGTAFAFTTESGTEVFTSSRHCTIEFANYVDPNGVPGTPSEGETIVEVGSLIIGQRIKLNSTPTSEVYIVAGTVPMEEAPHVWEVTIENQAGEKYRIKLSKTTKVVLVGWHTF